MTRLTTLALALTSLATPGLAAEAERLSPEAFEAYVTGKTLHYGFAGAPYGGEDYLENRRVRWSYLDGKCKEGHWYPDQGEICFVYEDDPAPQCWSFFFRDGALVAQFENNTEYTELYETGLSEDPLYCMGPDLGV